MIKVNGTPVVGHATSHANGDAGIVVSDRPQWHGGSHVVKVNGERVSVPTLVVLMTSSTTGLTRWVATHYLSI